MLAISRRAFVTRLGFIFAAGGAVSVLAACGTSTPPAPAATSAPAAPGPAAAPAAAPTAVPAAAQPTTTAAQPTTAPAAPTAAAAAPAKDSATLNVAAWPSHINPWLNSGGDWHSAFLYNRLLVWNITFDNVVPDLAEKWTASADGTEYTFNLRKGVKWHDGQPFTAADVEFSFQRLVDSPTASPRGTYLASLSGAADYAANKSDTLPGVAVIDESTIKLTLDGPSGPFLSGLAALSILPKHLLGDVPPDQLSKHDYFQNGFVGTGPFKLTKHVPDQYMELARYPDYYAGSPKLGGVVVRKITAPGAAALALEKGEVDFATLTSDESQRIANLAAMSVIGTTNFGFNGLSINLTKPGLSDKRVRQAFLLAIDRKAIVEKITKDPSKVVNQPFMVPWVQATDLNTYEYNPDKARAMLKDANWDTAKELELSYYYADQVSRNVVTAIQQQLGAVGVKIAQIQQLESPAFVQKVYQNLDFDVAYVGHGGGEPNDYLRYFHSQYAYPKGFNYFSYKNPKIDELFEQGRSTVDPESRKPIYFEIERILNDDLPILPLWETIRYAGFTKRLQNFVWTGVSGFYGMAYQDDREKWTLAA
jgi:peptide/nickel transport system substrate-binding protein